jgi:hypothetical protein
VLEINVFLLRVVFLVTFVGLLQPNVFAKRYYTQDADKPERERLEQIAKRRADEATKSAVDRCELLKKLSFEVNAGDGRAAVQAAGKPDYRVVSGDTEYLSWNCPDAPSIALIPHKDGRGDKSEEQLTAPRNAWLGPSKSLRVFHKRKGL